MDNDLEMYLESLPSNLANKIESLLSDTGLSEKAKKDLLAITMCSHITQDDKSNPDYVKEVVEKYKTYRSYLDGYFN